MFIRRRYTEDYSLGSYVRETNTNKAVTGVSVLDCTASTRGGDEIQMSKTAHHILSTAKPHSACETLKEGHNVCFGLGQSQNKRLRPPMKEQVCSEFDWGNLDSATEVGGFAF